jgi:hypothetical protein
MKNIKNLMVKLLIFTYELILVTNNYLERCKPYKKEIKAATIF